MDLLSCRPSYQAWAENVLDPSKRCDFICTNVFSQMLHVNSHTFIHAWLDSFIIYGPVTDRATVIPMCSSYGPIMGPQYISLVQLYAIQTSLETL